MALSGNGRFHAMFDPIIQAISQGKKTSAAEKIENAPPTHPLETYTGHFAAEGYPDFAVRKNEEGLQACFVGSLDWSSLRHYHYNVFEWQLVGFKSKQRTRFDFVREDGQITKVLIKAPGVTFEAPRR